jgi:hypothetical protein
MDRIHYAGNSVVTGTAIAEALLEYARTLAAADESATVDVPSLLPDGSVVRSMFLVGPASQLISETEPGEHDEIIDDDLVAYLKRQAELTAHRSTTSVIPAPSPAAPGETIWGDDGQGDEL